jgi:hypothetical protein
MKIHTPFLRVGPAVLVAAVLLANMSRADDHSFTHDHLQPLPTPTVRGFWWSHHPSNLVDPKTPPNLKTVWTFLGSSHDRKKTLYLCKIDLVSPPTQELALSLYTLGIQGRKYHVQIHSLAEKDFRISKQKSKKLAGVPAIESGSDLKYWSWEIERTGRARWPIFGNPNPADAEGVYFIHLTKTCEFLVLVERWSHSPEVPEDKRQEADSKYLVSRYPGDENKNLPSSLPPLVGIILSNHDTTPPPIEGGGMDGDSSR